MGEGVGRRWEGKKEWEKGKGEGGREKRNGTRASEKVGGKEGMGEGVGRRWEGKKEWQKG